MIIDTHAHLTWEGLREDVPGVLARARAAGVGAVITVGTDPEDSRAAVDLARRHPDVWATVGVHPHDVAGLSEARLDELVELARSERVVAWGEIGLDYFRDRSPRQDQRRWFREQLVRAREAGLPVVIHDREAHADTLRILREELRDGLRGVFHCFSGDEAMAREVVRMGFYLSVPGTVTYPRNERLRRVVASVPLERVLLETDCPFLSPQPVRGRPNEPAHLIHTAREVARVRGLAVEDVARITARACRELFGVGPDEEPPRIAYPIRRSLYLNVTNRCTNRCAFCVKNRTTVVKGHDLGLGADPTREQVLEAVEAHGGPAAWDEVVFCGLGEPLLRLELVLDLAGELRRRGARRIRVNTDGLANRVHGRNVVPELAEKVDAVSVSLNAPDAATYERLCRPPVPDAFGAVLAFLQEAARRIPEVTATVVAVPGLDVEACRRVAARLGVGFRVRAYNEVG